MRFPRLAAIALSLAALVTPARPAEACATAPPPGVMVQIAEESAIIVWDAKAKREHFIRRASFVTKGKDFGFLVPTPDKPELAEVSDEVFTNLDYLTKPEVKYESKIDGIEPTTFCLGMFMLKASRSAAVETAAAPVRVLDAQRVAGYDAVVLEADSATALASWLKDHGYAERPDLSKWLEPYVAQKWKLTAFKIAATSEAQAIRTGAVRMSFTTDRPFYPYREPADQRENLPANLPQEARERLLRVFFLGTERMDGTIGAAKAPWPGKAIWSDRLDPARLGPVPFSIPEGAWLTMFEDKASPRPGTDDLFFAAAQDRAPVKPPVVLVTRSEKIPLPLDLILVGGVVTFVMVRRARKRKAAS
jgi:hypothetical protein